MTVHFVLCLSRMGDTRFTGQWNAVPCRFASLQALLPASQGIVGCLCDAHVCFVAMQFLYVSSMYLFVFCVFVCEHLLGWITRTKWWRGTYRIGYSFLVL